MNIDQNLVTRVKQLISEKKWEEALSVITSMRNCESFKAFFQKLTQAERNALLNNIDPDQKNMILLFIGDMFATDETMFDA